MPGFTLDTVIKLTTTFKDMKTKPRLVKETCIAGRVIDRTIRLSYGVVGGKKRAEKTNPTPESVRKNNDRIATLNLSRKINANFGPDDGHLILTYAKEPNQEEARHCFELFKRRLQRKAKKADLEVRMVWATELQSRVHHHVVISRIDLALIRECFTWGRVKWIPLDEESNGNYYKLAEYIIKETSENFRSPENQTKQRYSCTRNLESPIIVRQPASPKEFSIDRIKPIKGYQIDEDTVNEYENPVTGCPTISYMMTAIDAEPRLKRWRGGKHAKIVRPESLATFEQLRQIEFSDLFEWDYL